MKRVFTAMTALVGFATAVAAEDAPADGRGVFGFYGQINRGVLSYDDGLSRDEYWFVDNSKSVSRIGATWVQDMRDGWRFRARGELALRWKETNRIDQDNPHDRDYKFDRGEIRKVEVEFRHDDFGVLFAGQGAMAADGFTGLDLSLTTVVAGTPVQDAAGGMFLRRVDGANSTLRIRQAFRSMGSSRRLRLRYDSPMLGGWRLAIAAGREVVSEASSSQFGKIFADASARYDGDHGDFRLRGGGAYRWIENGKNVFIASGSVLHRPSGWNFTLATGHEAAGGRYSYGKIGYIARWFDIGQTALSIDYYSGQDLYGGNIAGAGNGDSVSYGFAVVQKMRDPKIDFYALIRRYEYDTPTVAYHDSIAFLAGARWQF
ncbi:hypothetical protein BXY66_2970 [Shimia isoporae]|uniref:Porin domain-containing protein n=1 Tax=Shimia isoporae TaxID=647720 RepID=A0A4R1N221_9RHOB|nr:porin [Shimia isoporae]TCL00329.1 hypothetical protein BXY66_2970 [Shimia isoporae]